MLSAAPIRPLANSHATADAQFIASMIAALDGHERGTVANDALLQQTAFRVYRNTVRLGALDALRANYPTVLQLVGEEWFSAAAHRFLDRQPPASPCLLDYGAGFDGFLAALDASAELPYLPAIATLDRAWTEAHCAADASALTVANMQALLGSGERIYPHPATRAFWFADTPAAQLWCASRSGVDDLSTIEWQGAGALLTRPHGAVLWSVCDEAAVALVAMFAAGVGIADAIEQTASRFGAETTGRAFHQLLNQGALTTAPAAESS
ncbi:DNA-binding domain-containing protein [Casimicrobium huifangae]|uniref:DNA-binding domain-containing protein n=1 Tax=Casimicrobium huifangae TaxID=2591109 RepID=UPI0037848C06